MTIRQIKFDELNDENLDYATAGIGQPSNRSSYEALKVLAELLVPHNTLLVIYETGGDIDFSLGVDVASMIINEGDLRQDGALVIAPDYCYDPDAYTPGDDPYGRADANQPLDALGEANRLLADQGLEIVMDDDGDFLIKIVRLGFTTASAEFSDPFNGTVKRDAPNAASQTPTMEDLLRLAGVNPGLAGAVESGSFGIPTTDEVVDASDGMRTFEKAIPPAEPEFEVEVNSLDLDEVIDLLKDKTIFGKVREQLHQRLDVLVLR